MAPRRHILLMQVAEIQESKLNHANNFKVSAYITPLNIPLAKVSHIAQTNISFIYNDRESCKVIWQGLWRYNPSQGGIKELGKRMQSTPVPQGPYQTQRANEVGCITLSPLKMVFLILSVFITLCQHIYPKDPWSRQEKSCNFSNIIHKFFSNIIIKVKLTLICAYHMSRVLHERFHLVLGWCR